MGRLAKAQLWLMSWLILVSILMGTSQMGFKFKHVYWEYDRSELTYPKVLVALWTLIRPAHWV